MTPFAPIGRFPSPVVALDALAETIGRPGAPLWAKREDLSAQPYGGNKVRTLEILLGAAVARGARQIIATGAFGSNFALATAIYAPRLALQPHLLLFPQPKTDTAVKNLRAMLTTQALITPLPHWACLPAAGRLLQHRAKRRHVAAALFPPGGALPLGTLAHASAALELGQQVAAHALPMPGEIVLAAGSTTTTAGLLIGLHHAHRLGWGFTQIPTVRAVAVTPWPVTAARQIARLAHAGSQLLARLTGDPRLVVSVPALLAHLVVVRGYLGRGYGHPTAKGQAAAAAFCASRSPALDLCYSAKAAAHALDRARQDLPHPLLFWASKSTAPLPTPTAAQLDLAPPALLPWLRGSTVAAHDWARTARALFS